jgi:hypothetical protein
MAYHPMTRVLTEGPGLLLPGTGQHRSTDQRRCAAPWDQPGDVRHNH